MGCGALGFGRSIRSTLTRARGLRDLDRFPNTMARFWRGETEIRVRGSFQKHNPWSNRSWKHPRYFIKRARQGPNALQETPSRSNLAWKRQDQFGIPLKIEFGRDGQRGERRSLSRAQTRSRWLSPETPGASLPPRERERERDVIKFERDVRKLERETFAPSLDRDSLRLRLFSFSFFPRETELGE